jgi:hypothetical protein
MVRQLSQAPGTRPFASGMRFLSARVARRVARADLTTVGSSDDAVILRRAWTLSPCRGLFVFVPFLVLWILASRSDPFHTQYIFVLGTAISKCQTPFLEPPHTSHLYPRIPTHTTHTHTYYTVHTTHASILCIHNFILLYHRLITRRLDLLHSLFPVCSVRFALILYLSLLSPVSLPLLLLLSTF